MVPLNRFLPASGSLLIITSLLWKVVSNASSLLIVAALYAGILCYCHILRWLFIAFIGNENTKGNKNIALGRYSYIYVSINDNKGAILLDPSTLTYAVLLQVSLPAWRLIS